MSILKVQKNDIGKVLNFTATDANGTIINCDDKVITFRMRKEGLTTNQVSGTCVVVSGAIGTCTYTSVSGDFDTEGMYKGELEIRSGSVVVTGTNIEVRVGGEYV